MLEVKSVMLKIKSNVRVFAAFKRDIISDIEKFYTKGKVTPSLSVQVPQIY